MNLALTADRVAPVACDVRDKVIQPPHSVRHVGTQARETGDEILARPPGLGQRTKFLNCHPEPARVSRAKPRGNERHAREPGFIKDDRFNQED